MWLVLLSQAGFPMVDFPWWEGFLEEENHTQIKINYPPPYPSTLWSGLFDQEYVLKKFEGFCILYLIVLHMELHCYVNVCPNLLKRQKQIRVYACKR